MYAGRQMKSRRLEELAALRSSIERLVPAAEIAYLTLREAIYREILPGGEPLHEADLATALQVSRTPVREALARLLAEGLVAYHPPRGLVVREVTTQEIEDVFEVRFGIDPLAARLAAQRASQVELTMLHSLLSQMEEATGQGDWDRLVGIALRFHQVLYEATRNARLAELATRLYAFVHRAHQSTLRDPERARRALEEHKELLEAIAARDPERAETVMRAHLEHALRARLARQEAAPA